MKQFKLSPNYIPIVKKMKKIQDKEDELIVGDLIVGYEKS